MRTVLFAFILTIVFGSFFSLQAQTGQEAAVRVNKQKKFSKSKLTIKFVSLIEDSRCPQGTDCIWAGNAKVKIKVTGKKGKSETFELNTTLEPKSVKFEGYEIKLVDVTPYPRANVRIDPRGYTARLSVTKL